MRLYKHLMGSECVGCGAESHALRHGECAGIAIVGPRRGACNTGRGLTCPEGSAGTVLSTARVNIPVARLSGRRHTPRADMDADSLALPRTVHPARKGQRWLHLCVSKSLAIASRLAHWLHNGWPCSADCLLACACSLRCSRLRVI